MCVMREKSKKLGVGGANKEKGNNIEKRKLRQKRETETEKVSENENNEFVKGQFMFHPVSH